MAEPGDPGSRINFNDYLKIYKPELNIIFQFIQVSKSKKYFVTSGTDLIHCSEKGMTGATHVLKISFLREHNLFGTFN